MANKVRTTPDQKISVSGGTLVIDDTNNHTGVWTSLVVTADTAVSVCTGLDANGTAYDFKSTSNWTTLKQNDLLICPDNYCITSITLTSGRVLANGF